MTAATPHPFAADPIESNRPRHPPKHAQSFDGTPGTDPRKSVKDAIAAQRAKVLRLLCNALASQVVSRVAGELKLNGVELDKLSNPGTCMSATFTPEELNRLTYKFLNQLHVDPVTWQLRSSQAAPAETIFINPTKLKVSKMQNAIIDDKLSHRTFDLDVKDIASPAVISINTAATKLRDSDGTLVFRQVEGENMVATHDTLNYWRLFMVKVDRSTVMRGLVDRLMADVQVSSKADALLSRIENSETRYIVHYLAALQAVNGADQDRWPLATIESHHVEAVQASLAEPVVMSARTAWLVCNARSNLTTRD